MKVLLFIPAVIALVNILIYVRKRRNLRKGICPKCGEPITQYRFEYVRQKFVGYTCLSCGYDCIL